MRRLLIVVAALVALAAVSAWLLTMPTRVIAANSADNLLGAGDAARGKIIFDAGGCASCHATPNADPEKVDRTRLGGGFALATPFGTFRAPNISPDPRDGIGAWSFADFANAVMAGVAPDGSHYYPAFPYTTYAHMKIADARDLFAYLRSLPPVAGKAAPHEIAFPFNQRRALGLWKLLYLDRKPVADDPGQSAEWNRGRYLADALGHCAECHSPRDGLGGIVEAQRYAGGPDVDGKGWVPNLTPAPGGISDWSKADIAGVLENGGTPDGDFVGASMAEVVRNTADLPKDDRDAIAVYIKSLPARTGPPKPKKPAS